MFVQIFQKAPFWNFRPESTPPPHFGKVQIWDDQSFLVYSGIPPISEKFRFEMNKVYSGIPPISEKFRFEMSKVSSFTPEYPPFQKSSDLRWPKFTPEYPPISEKLRFQMTKVYSGIPPSPFRKSSDLRWPKFTPEYPPISEKFRFEMTKVYSRIPPPPTLILENFRFEMTKIYSRIPPSISENAGDRMWRLICNPQGYHSLGLVLPQNVLDVQGGWFVLLTSCETAVRQTDRHPSNLFNTS